MIEPTADDVGRAVIYTGNRYPGGKPEDGVITGFNHWQVFVRYAADKSSKATSRKDLEWAHQPNAGPSADGGKGPSDTFSDGF